MRKSIITSVLFVVMSFFLNSCEGDCKDEQIEKTEWITKYEDITKDTLVAYTVIENKREYIKFNEEIKHTVTIRNNNSLYNGRFSLNADYGYYNYGEETKTKEFDFVTIAPKSSHTFTFYSQAGKYANYNSSYVILQNPTTYTYKERKDELKTENITVNSCSENVEALREKYRTIKELYKSKTDSISNNKKEEPKKL